MEMFKRLSALVLSSFFIFFSLSVNIAQARDYAQPASFYVDGLANKVNIQQDESFGFTVKVGADGENTRLPLDVVFVLDTSYSSGFPDSEGNIRIVSAAEAIKNMLKELNPSIDRAALIIYDNNEIVLADFTRAKNQGLFINISEVNSVLDAIIADPNDWVEHRMKDESELGDALFDAYNELDEYRVTDEGEFEDVIQAVIVIGDGKWNDGSYKPEEVIGKLSDNLKGFPDTSIFAIGYGEDPTSFRNDHGKAGHPYLGGQRYVNGEEELRAIVNYSGGRGQGWYQYAENTTRLFELAANAINDAKNQIAVRDINVKIQLSANFVTVDGLKEISYNIPFLRNGTNDQRTFVLTPDEANGFFNPVDRSIILDVNQSKVDYQALYKPKGGSFGTKFVKNFSQVSIRVFPSTPGLNIQNNFFDGLNHLDSISPIYIGDEFETIITIGNNAGGYLDPPIDVVLIMDKTGSMKSKFKSGETSDLKIEVAKRVMKDFIKYFEDNPPPNKIRISLVTFDNKVRDNLGLNEDFSGIKQAIDNVEASGSTSIGAGLCAGIDNIKPNKSDPAFRRVIVLASDGKQNANPKPKACWDDENDPQRSQVLSSSYIYAIGIDNRVNENSLREIVDHGNGLGGYYYAGTESQLKEIYDTIARAIALNITADNIQALYEPLNEFFEIVDDGDGNSSDGQINIGNLDSDAEVSRIVRLRSIRSTNGIEQNILGPSASINYNIFEQPVSDNIPQLQLRVLGICGDGVLQSPNDDGEEEQCDDGNNNNGDGCDSSCVAEVCGNGIVQTGEQCDDGNNNNGDGCDSSCVAEVCGNGIVQTGEQCDDGFLNSDTTPNACRTTCVLPYCGDNVIDSDEQCDNGVLNSDIAPNACRTTCVLPYCGDYVVDTGEQCDEGAANSNTNPDACRLDCSLPVCGDGIKDTGEECDDGNLFNNDKCSDACQFTYCGDGIVQSPNGEDPPIWEDCEIGDDKCEDNCQFAQCRISSVNPPSGSTISLELNKTVNIGAIPDTAYSSHDYIWYTDNPSVVSLSSRLFDGSGSNTIQVTAIGSGEAKVFIKDLYADASCGQFVRFSVPQGSFLPKWREIHPR